MGHLPVYECKTNEDILELRRAIARRVGELSQNPDFKWEMDCINVDRFYALVLAVLRNKPTGIYIAGDETI